MDYTDPAILAAVRQLKAYMDSATPAEAARIYAEKKAQFGFTDAEFNQAAFDPTGFDKQYSVGPTAPNEQNSMQGDPGTQSGWSKSLGNGTTQQYDMAGNKTTISQDKDQGDYLRNLAALAAIAVTAGGAAGAGPLGGLLGGGTAATGAAATGAAANGGFTAAEIAANAGASAMTGGTTGAVVGGGASGGLLGSGTGATGAAAGTGAIGTTAGTVGAGTVGAGTLGATGGAIGSTAGTVGGGVLGAGAGAATALGGGLTLDNISQWAKNNAGSIGAVVGALGGSMDSTKTDSAKKEPWAEAAPWMKANIASGQALQNFYKANPFNDQQKIGYQNLFNGINGMNQSVPGLLDFANKGMTGNYQRAIGGAVGSGGGYGGARVAGGLLQGSGNPFVSPQTQNYGLLDWQKLIGG